MSREERARLAEEAKALFLEIAKERSWLPVWESDTIDFKECIFMPGNPRLEQPLELWAYAGLVSLGDPGAPSFTLDAAGRVAFRAEIDRWIAAQAEQGPGRAQHPGISDAPQTGGVADQTPSHSSGAGRSSAL